MSVSKAALTPYEAISRTRRKREGGEGEVASPTSSPLSPLYSPVRDMSVRMTEPALARYYTR